MTKAFVVIATIGLIAWGIGALAQAEPEHKLCLNARSIETTHYVGSIPYTDQGLVGLKARMEKEWCR